MIAGRSATSAADVTVQHADGLPVRLRSSKPDQEAHGQIKALPYGRDPVTCPPCAYVRGRQMLHACDSAAAVRHRINADTAGCSR